jgi:hypothetical protein
MGELGMTGVDISVTDSPSWRCHTMLEKEWVANDLDGIHQAGDREVNHYVGNTLMNQGGGILWQRLIGITPSTSATGATMQAFSTANAAIGVGDSTADVAVTQTDLQAPASSASRWIKGMQASYPSNSTVNFATSSGAF